MICVTLTPDQFDEIVRDGGWKSGSLDFLSRVFVDGMDVSDAAKLSELSNSRGYNLAPKGTFNLSYGQIKGVLVDEKSQKFPNFPKSKFF